VPIGQDGLLASTFASRFADVAAAVSGRACGDCPRHWGRLHICPAGTPDADCAGTDDPGEDQPDSLPRSPVRRNPVHLPRAVHSGPDSLVLQRRPPSWPGSRGEWACWVRAGGDQIGPTGRHSGDPAGLRHCRRRSSVAGAGVEDVGISTFLHVPSPVCSNNYGRRRAENFIFEARNGAVTSARGQVFLCGRRSSRS